MSSPDRPLSSHLDFSGLDADELEALLRVPEVDFDRSLIGIPPCENDNPYYYPPSNPESPTNIPSSDHQSHAPLTNDAVHLNNSSLVVHNSYAQQSASSQPASHASRSPIPQITFDELPTSTPQLMLLIPDLGLASQEPPLSPGLLDTLSRLSDHDLLTPTSSSSIGYTSSESMDWDMIDDDSLNVFSEQDQQYLYEDEHQYHSVLQPLQQEEPLSPLAHRPKNPSYQGLLDDQYLLTGEKHVAPGSPGGMSLSNMVEDGPSTANQGACSMPTNDSPPSGGKHKRKRLTQEKLRQVNRMRKLKACIRCQVLRIKCGCGDSCRACQLIQDQGTAKIWKMPCFRARLSDAGVFRTGWLSFPQGVRKIDEWATENNVELRLYHVGVFNDARFPEDRPNLRVVCRQFSPLPEDRLSKSWISHGQKVDFELPTYAIPERQLKKTAEKLDELIAANFHRLLTELTYSQDEIVTKALAEAARHAEDCEMLQRALHIAIMTRLASKSFNMTGAETLGLVPIEDVESPYCGRIPIPPFLDAQLDSILIGKMGRIQKKVLSELKSTIMSSDRRQNWFRIFLTVLVLLSNLEYVYQKQCEQMQRYIGSCQQPSSMMNYWKHSAEILIVHFHAISQGNIPLTIDWKEEDRQAAGMDDRAMAFVIHLKGLVETRFRELKDRASAAPETPLKWISTLLLPPKDA